MHLRDDVSVAGMAEAGVGAGSTMPNSGATSEHTIYDPLGNPHLHDDGNDGDADDDRPSPFPEYRERNDDDDDDDDESDVTLESHDHDPLGIAVSSDPARAADVHGRLPSETMADDGEPPPAEPPAEPGAASASQPAAESSSDPESPSLASPEAASAPSPDAAPEPPSTTPTLPPPPPPYWTHSRDSAQGHGGRSTTADPDAVQPARTTARPAKPKAVASFFGAPFLRRLDSTHSETGASSSSSSAAAAARPPAVRVATGPSALGHRRAASSSSTLDLQANLITLQDNEASSDDDDDDGYHNFDATFSPAGGAPPPSSLSVASPTSLLSPGPPPRSAGSGRADAATAAPLAATRTSSSTAKQNRCWARRVDITDHVLVGAGSSSGSSLFPGLPSSSRAAHPRLGAFVVWTIRVQTLDDAAGRPLPSPSPSPPPAPASSSSSSGAGAGGHAFCIYKRYSEFDALRRRLVASFPQARGGGALPPLPPKSVLGKFRPAFLEQRRLGLQYFLNCILLNPEFAGSPVLQEFLFS